MRRIAMMFGAVTAAGLMGIGLPATASAAEGELTINDETVENPSGCVPGPSDSGVVENNTGSEAAVFLTPGCASRPAAFLQPGEVAELPFIGSVSVD